MKQRPLLLIGLMILNACASGAKPQRFANSFAEKKLAFAQLIHDFSRTKNAKGAAAIYLAADGQVYKAHYGQQDEQHPFTTQTPLPIGSITKSLTGLWFLHSQSQHHYNLNTQVLPDSPVTFSELFGHSSGLPSSIHAGMYSFGCAPTRLSAAQLNELLKLRSPGQFRYSNLGYELLATRTAEALKAPFEASMLKTLHGIGLKNLSWMNCQNPLLPGYSQGKSMKPAYLRDLAAGGLVANAEDMALYLNMLLHNKNAQGDRLLPSLEPLWRSHIDPQTQGYGHAYGMGWNLKGVGQLEGEDIIWHRGGSFPYQATVALLPQRKSAFVYVSNTFETSQDIYPLMREVFGSMSGMTVTPPRPAPQPTITPQQWEGDYVGLGDQLMSFKAQGKDLKTTLMGTDATLLKQKDRWEPQISLFWGVLKFPMGKGVWVDFKPTEQTLLIQGWGQPLPVTRLNPLSLSSAWKTRLGKYQAVGTAKDQAVMDMTHLTLIEYKGTLLAQIRAHNPAIGTPVMMQTPLIPRDDENALSAQEGLPLLVKGEKLHYSGFVFERIPHDH